jgi:endonuclease G, mitochondrial
MEIPKYDRAIVIQVVKTLLGKPGRSTRLEKWMSLLGLTGTQFDFTISNARQPAAEDIVTKAESLDLSKLCNWIEKGLEGDSEISPQDKADLNSLFVNKEQKIWGTDARWVSTALIKGLQTQPLYESVAHIKVKLGQNFDHEVGTAWLIAPNLVITNHHVIAAGLSMLDLVITNDHVIAAGLSTLDAELWFDYYGEDDSQEVYKVSKVVVCNLHLDYAILEIGSSDPQKQEQLHKRRPLPLNLNSQIHNEKNPAITIIQHPDGKPQKIGFREAPVTLDHTGQFLYYKTDTMPGSSGSPVLDKSWRVIALHLGSYRDKANQGIPISTIYYDLDMNTRNQIDKVNQF